MVERIIEGQPGKTKTLKLIAMSLKAITGIVGGSFILTEQHPYLALLALSIGALTNELLNHLNTND